MSLRCVKCDPILMVSGAVVPNWGRTCGISLPYDRYGGFIETDMVPIVTAYADFVDYPKGDWLLKDKDTDGKVTDIAISDDGIHLFTGSADGFISHWDLRLCKLVHRWKAHYKVTCLAYRSCLLASGSKDGTVKIWDTHNHTFKLQYISQGIKPIQYLEFNESGDTLLSYDGALMALSAVDKHYCVFSINTPQSFGYLPIYQNNNLSIISSRGSVFKWDVASQTKVRHERRMNGGITMDKNMVDLNCDGTLIAYLLETNIVVMRWPELELVSTIEGTFDSLHFHPSNPQVIAVSGIGLYDILNRQWLRYSFIGPYTDHSQLLFTPDGYRIIAVLPGSDEIEVWDMEEAQKMCEPEPSKIYVNR